MTSFILDNIQLRNVRCYGDEVMSMDFPLNNLTVFTGHVGAGKSTILKAVSMALYGEDGGAKGEKLSIDDMLNEKNMKNLEIHLFFHSINDVDNSEHKYEIHLFHKHTKYNNKLVFVKDGKDISLESKTATYELIEKTLIPKNVYHNIYYFTQQAKNFFTALPNGEQKEIFNSILDLSEYQQYYENAKNKISEYQNECQIKQNEIESQRKNTDTLENLKNNAQTDLYNLKEQNKKKIDELRQQIDKTRSCLENCKDIKQTDIDKINEQINEIKNKQQLLQSEYITFIKSCDKDITNIKENFTSVVIPALKDKYIKLKLEQCKQLDDNIASLKLELEKCNQSIQKLKSDLNLKLTEEKNIAQNEYNEKVKKIQDEVNNLNNDLIIKDKDKVKKLTSRKDEVQDKVYELKAECETHNRNISSVKNSIMYMENNKNEKLSKIQKYKDDLNKPDAICSLCGQKLVSKDHVQKHIDTLTKEVEEITFEIVRFESEIEDDDKQVKLLQDQINDLVSKFKEEVKQKEEEYNNYKIKINARILQLKSDIDNEKEKYDVKCKQLLDKYQYDINNEFEQLVVKYSNDIKSCENSKNELIDKLRNQYKEEYTKLTSEMNDKVNNINKEIEKKTLEHKQSQEIYCIKLAELEINKNDFVKYKDDRDSLDNALKNYQLELDKLSDTSGFDARKKQIEDFEEIINKSKQTEIKSVSELKSLTKDKEILEFWKNAFSDSGIKSMLIDSAIPHMNECVSQELERVAPGIFTVSFDTLSETKSGKVKDKFNINIVNNVKGSTGHRKLSGGEKRIIDLCCMTALRSLAEKLYNKRFCHIFYDEILDSLDNECKQMFCNNIKRQSSDGCNITLVTHDLPEDVDPDRTFPF